MVRVIGIGGGAGAGKTTIASFLQDKGIKVLELDALGRKLSQKGGPIWKEVVRTWDRFFLDRQGNIDRRKLRRAAFQNFKVLFHLNQLTHPLLLRETRKWLNRNRQEEFVAVEGAILFEGKFLPFLDWIVFVEADSHRRAERLRAKGCQERDAQNLVKAQRFSPCLQKRAHFVICNQNSKEKLREDVEYFWEHLLMSGK
ncbi:MAG: dephospho-CoA kinase [Candidatus Caldatribacteriaceae bacterium]